MLKEPEKNIICLLAKNFSRQVIADKLFISPHTVNKYILVAKEKCHCKSTLELLTICADDIQSRNFSGEKNQSGTGF